MNLNISRPQYERLTIYFNFDNYAEYTLICCNSYDTPYDLIEALISYCETGRGELVIKEAPYFIEHEILIENKIIKIINTNNTNILYTSPEIDIKRTVDNMVESSNKYFFDIVNWNRTAPYDSLFKRLKRIIRLHMLIKKLKGTEIKYE